MIREPNPQQISFDEFKTPFEKGLDKNNRWIVLADRIPWVELTKIYTKKLSKKMGRPAKPSRIVIGALIIKHKLRLPDEETTVTIKENPYHQYFIGYKEFSHEEPFDPSLFVTIRKRLGQQQFEAMTDAFLKIVEKVESSEEKDTSDLSDSDNFQKLTEKTEEIANTEDNKKNENNGTLLLDATVAPADIKYPTDLDLLNTGREHSERIIDILWKQNPVGGKPRTYRRVARKAYLALAKKKKKSSKEIRKGIRKQLNYLHRNINTINEMLDSFKDGVIPLRFRDLRIFWIIQELYRQQQEMYDLRTHQIKDRIVSISQPHVRPIVRGKSGKDVEFGAKISASLWNGYGFLDRLSWDAFNESGDLISQVERFKKRFGCFPALLIADEIYGTRVNRTYLQSNNIRYTFKPLGRPAQKEVNQSKVNGKQRKMELGLRNHIEGKFGEGKRAYDLDLVKAKLPETSESWIAAIFFVMNLARWLRDYFFVFVRNIIFCRQSQFFCYFKAHSVFTMTLLNA